MGLKAPGYTPMSPTQQAVFIDPVPANAAHPGGIDAVQHALATAGHNFGITVGMLQEDNATLTLIVPVPPSVVYMRLSVVMQGVGTVSIDSTNNGTAKSWEVTGPKQYQNFPMAAFVLGTTGIPGNLKSSPLKVRSSAAWTWTTEVVTVTFTSATAGDGVIHAVCFDPIFEAQSV